MKIAHIFADSQTENNSSMFRGVYLLNALQRAGHTIAYSHIDAWMKDQKRSDLADADIIVIERVLVEEAVDRVKFWKERGKAVVIDIDDAYQLLQPYEESGNQAAKFWQKGEVEISYPGGIKVTKKLEVSPLEQFRKGLQYCAGLTMPSHILAEDWSPYAKCWYVPNYLNQDNYLPHRQDKLPHRKDEIVIGWGGSMSHKLSFEKSGVATALRNVLQKRPQAKFMLCGDQRILDIVKLPPQQVIYQHYVTWNEWPRCLARFDIGIAPLHARYDSSRSAIKCEEFCTMGIPFIATGCATYIDFQRAGVGNYVEDGPDTPQAIQGRADEWERTLLGIVDNYAQARSHSLDDLSYAHNWWADNNIGNIAATYESIIASSK